MDSKLSDEDKGYIGNSSSSGATGVALAGGAASDVDSMRPWRALGSAAFRAAPFDQLCSRADCMGSWSARRSIAFSSRTLSTSCVPRQRRTCKAHKLGALSTLLSSQGHLSICSGPHPGVRAMDVLGSSVQVLHVFSDQVF